MEIRHEDLCLDASESKPNAKVQWYDCHEMQGNQKWINRVCSVVLMIQTVTIYLLHFIHFLAHRTFVTMGLRYSVDDTNHSKCQVHFISFSAHHTFVTMGLRYSVDDTNHSNCRVHVISFSAHHTFVTMGLRYSVDDTNHSKCQVHFISFSAHHTFVTMGLRYSVDDTNHSNCRVHFIYCVSLIIISRTFLH